MANYFHTQIPRLALDHFLSFNFLIIVVSLLHNCRREAGTEILLKLNEFCGLVIFPLQLQFLLAKILSEAQLLLRAVCRKTKKRKSDFSSTKETGIILMFN